jgi:hypothetical protein
MKLLKENTWLIRTKNQDSILTDEVEIDAEGKKLLYKEPEMLMWSVAHT